MAQHFRIDEKYVGETDEETKAIRRLVRSVRADIRKAREDDTELDPRYKRLPDEFLDGTETEGYLTSVDVPDTMVAGGRANLELRFRMSVLSKIYLVA